MIPMGPMLPAGLSIRARYINEQVEAGVGPSEVFDMVKSNNEFAF